MELSVLKLSKVEMVGHPKSDIEVDVSLYKVVGGRAMRWCYDYTHTRPQMSTYLKFY